MLWPRLLCLFLLASLAVPDGLCADEAESRIAERRARMVEVIERHARRAPNAFSGDVIEARVLEVMGRVPRHAFVPERQRPHAYDDRPLGIGHGQTISQPFIVALMTDLLDVEPGHTVLEIGTGSGYQAAVLGHLARKVCTIEIIPALGRMAATRLELQGYENVSTKIGDGYLGWPDCGPFDGILVTAAASHIPPPLIEQLKPGGRMVIPVGGPFATQQLVLAQKTETGQVKTHRLLAVRFVPFTRKP